MERKIDYNKKMLEIINEIKRNGKKPKLLLHACCGPCFTIPNEKLKDFFDITILFNNSNIYPKEEHDRRLTELKKYLFDIDSKINVVEIPYDNITYNIDLEPYKNEKEGNERCRVCFKKRLEFGMKFASDNNYDFFGTVMTISRYKNAQDINKIGEKLQNDYPKVKWLYADFKKNNGYEDSLIIVRNHKMYFQEYCGCKYSFEKYSEKKQKVSKNN